MNTANIKTVVEQMNKEKAPLLQVLLAVQDISQERYISEKAINEIAHLLNISRSRVYSTASFYSEISLKPRGLHLIRVCTNAPCENSGKAQIQKAIEKELGIGIGQTTFDGFFTLESVNCLGACYMSPAIKVDDIIYGNLTPRKAIIVIRNLRKEHQNEQTA